MATPQFERAELRFFTDEMFFTPTARDFGDSR